MKTVERKVRPCWQQKGAVSSEWVITFLCLPIPATETKTPRKEKPENWAGEEKSGLLG